MKTKYYYRDIYRQINVRVSTVCLWKQVFILNWVRITFFKGENTRKSSCFLCLHFNEKRAWLLYNRWSSSILNYWKTYSLLVFLTQTRPLSPAFRLPARHSMRVVFPEPLGPRIPVNCPLTICPLTSFKIVLSLFLYESLFQWSVSLSVADITSLSIISQSIELKSQ